jgi:hypothetical protein
LNIFGSHIYFLQYQFKRGVTQQRSWLRYLYYKPEGRGFHS